MEENTDKIKGEIELDAKWTTPPAVARSASARPSIPPVKLDPVEVELEAHVNPTSISAEFLTPANSQENLTPAPQESVTSAPQESATSTPEGIDPAFLTPPSNYQAAHDPAESAYAPHDLSTEKGPDVASKAERPTASSTPNVQDDAPSPAQSPSQSASPEPANGPSNPTQPAAGPSTPAPAPSAPGDKGSPQDPKRSPDSPKVAKSTPEAKKPALSSAPKDNPLNAQKRAPAPKDPAKDAPKPAASSPVNPKANPASTAKQLMAKDPNAGSAGKGAKVAGALGAAKGALEGFNQGGLKGAALKGAAGAKQGASNANAKAAAGQNGKTNGKVKGAASAAGQGAKAALIAWLTSSTGVPPRVWAMIISKQGLMVLVASIMVPIMLLAGFFIGLGPRVETPSEASNAQAANYTPSGWQNILEDAAYNTRRESIPVPWTVLAGVAAATTNFGASSPYDTENHDPDRPDKILDVSVDVPAAQAYAPGTYASGSCDANIPTPVIGGGEGEAKGPFLLKNYVWKQLESQGKDTNNPCQVADWLAQQLSKKASELLKSDPSLKNPWQNATKSDDEAARDKQIQENADFWAKVIAYSNLIEDPTSGSAGGDCMVTTSADASNYPIDYLIERIWNCEIGKGSPPLLVSKLTQARPEMPVSYTLVPQNVANVTLIQEAYNVSYAYSGWSTKNCSNNAKVAGIFPLDQATAKAYGAPDRCDPQQNIRAAARAVLATERVEPSSRMNAEGTYQPMLGGWLNLSDVFGKDLETMLTSGPASAWEPDTDCQAAMDSYLEKVARNDGSFATLPTQDVVDTQEWTKKLQAAQDPAFTLDDVRAQCTGAPDVDLYDQLSVEASNFASLYETDPNAVADTTNTSTVVDGSVYNGLSQLFSIRSSDTFNALPQAKYGQNAVVGSRLSSDTSAIAAPPTNGTTLSQPMTSISEKISEYAVFFGGVDPLFDTVGLRIGSLALTGNFSGLNSGEIPSYLVPIILKYGSQPPLTPALLAAQLKQESNFDPKITSPVGAQGIAQFMPSTWEAEGIDANKDGVADVNDPEDAIASQASYMIKLYNQVINSGIPGDPMALTLASYNAGFGRVKEAGGIPNITETQNYIKKIQTYEVTFSTPPSASADLTGLKLNGGGPGAWGGYTNGRIPESALKPLSWTGTSRLLRCDAAKSLEALNIKYAADHGGHSLTVNDAYRNYDRQVVMRATKGGMAAVPGTSNHGWGLAVDLQVGGQSSETYKWLSANAPSYGWQNPPWAHQVNHLEPWHWEYQGQWAGSC